MAELDNKELTKEDYSAVRSVLGGDTFAFQILQDKYINLVASLIRRMIRNEQDVEDLTQETFIKAYKALNTFQFKYTFSAWIYRIASNNCIDFLRKKRFQTLSLDQSIGNDEDNYYIQVEDKSNMPDLNVLFNERKKVLNDAIAKLPENYKQIIKLRHELELDYTEIAQQLNIPLGTVKAHLFRARKILFTKLRKNRHLFIDL